MIDHLLGRPSVSWKRTQVFLLLFFWAGVISNGPNNPILLAKVNKFLSRSLERYSPWKVIASTLTIIYGARNLDNILGLSAPEPLARLYSRSYYRATWISVALDAGFATAMYIKPKWLRDICSILFSFYYLLYANAADEKLRKYRATCTTESLRVTWEKTGNPYIRAITYFERPRLPVARQILLPRPSHSKHRKPITAWLYWSRPENEIESASDLILDIPGGGFISIGPQHHEERLRRWALVSGRPVLSIDYGKAPECTCLDFNFGSWMTPANLRVLKAEASSSNIAGVEEQKAHTDHRSPLAVVSDVSERRVRRRRSWARLSLTSLASRLSGSFDENDATPRASKRPSLARSKTYQTVGDESDEADDEFYPVKESDKPISERVLYTAQHKQTELEVVMEEEKIKALEAKGPSTGTRLTMTSRAGYFADRVITPSMVSDPDFERDYYISPILAPASLLAQFPPILMTCGEKDPFVDDTVIFAGRVREAKRALRATLQMEAAGKSAKFGEGLRMSVATSDKPQARLLQEAEEDWVQMELFEGWSHGYLLMPSLMSEAREAIIRIGEWIDGAFVRHGRKMPPSSPTKSKGVRVRSPVRPTVSPTSVRRANLGGVVASSGTDTEAEGLVMPSKRRRSPPPSFGTATTERPTESSAETLVAAPIVTAKAGTKALDEAELIRRRRAQAAI
ncbi:hypothetical protein M408DRAFT_16757 [Serendipita vermifera MAFF 305830]|uniref:Alpha/beta hydrolase fold-3 domain-containing protein n=1 Tax=Serendipita vermifera MAFF 305830 TaxID=933852 RepID=A0A0C3AQS7_SERVB|nr:hypothetical protein M408DRAFT_16757 [Serendipita vermifera MAFF 305830]